MWIHELVKPIFKDLSSDELLSRCLHGKTQNGNEALNNIIWRKSPKGDFVDKDLLDCAVNSATVQFNEGPCGVLDIIKHFGFPAGVVMKTSSNKKARQRTNNIERKISPHGKQRRKTLRSLKRGNSDREKGLEGGESYVTGGF